MLTELPNLNNLFRLLFNIDSDIATEKKKNFVLFAVLPCIKQTIPANQLVVPKIYLTIIKFDLAFAVAVKDVGKE